MNIDRLRGRDVGVLILVSILVGILSAYMHLPQVPPPMGNLGLKYSDIVYGVFYPRFMQGSDHRDRYWYNTDPIDSLSRGERVCPLPYVDYMFEYPPLVALLWYISTCSSIRLSPGGPSPEGFNPATFLSEVAKIHYIISVIPLIISLSATSLFISSANSVEAALLWLLLPSTILYSTYNWDIICASLAFASLFMFQKRRYFASGLLLGLSIATKVMTASIAYVLFVYLLLKSLGKAGSRELLSFLLSLFLAGALPYIIVLIAAPTGFWDFISHHSSWYCENCLYLIFVHNVLDPTHRTLTILAISLLAVALAVAVYRNTGKTDSSKIYELATYSIIGAVTLNYVFSPQMVLMVSPFVVAFLSSRPNLEMYVIADTANFFIMALFFLDKDLRAFLSNIGIPIEVRSNPWGIDSPVQWVAAVRNVLLLIILVSGLLHSLKSPKRQIS